MLIRSISGVRGHTGSYLNPSISKKYAKALHSYFPNGVIMCGRDSRPSGEMIQNIMTYQIHNPIIIMTYRPIYGS